MPRSVTVSSGNHHVRFDGRIVLLGGPTIGAYWYGSQLTIGQAGAPCTYNSAFHEPALDRSDPWQFTNLRVA